MTQKQAVATVALVAGAAVWLALPKTSVHSQTGPALDETTAAFRVEFGVSDREPQSWDGRLSVTGGEVTALRNWRPRPGDAIQGTTSWKTATRQGTMFAKRPWEVPFLEPPQPYVLVPGLIVDVKGSRGTRVRMETPHGGFDVSPFDLQAGRAQSMLDGKVRVERVAVAQPVSSPDSQSDFATVLSHPSGEVWLAWSAFRNERNEIVARRFDGKSWAASEKVSGDHNDVFLVKAARAGNGNVWFVWSAQLDGNWDLYGRRWDGTSWSSIERLTTDPQPDIYHAMAADSAGNVWLTWQGFRNGKADVHARRWSGGSWSAEERVSSSPANDWNPAIAADGSGRVHIGWDTYDKDNYDIQLRTWENGQWGEVKPLVDTVRYEAYLSLACDKDNRLWAAWNESGHEWGKDTGFLLKIEGTRLYQSRTVKVAVLDNGQWKEPAQRVEESLPRDLQGYNDLPSLQADASGRMWLFFRHRMLRIRDVPSDAPAHRAAWEIYGVSYEGDRWSTPSLLPFSGGRQDMRTGFAAGPAGAIWAAYSTDHRDYEDFLFERVAVNAARLPVSTTTPAASKLIAWAPDKLAAPKLHQNEAEQLTRIRAYEMKSGGKAYKIFRGDTHRHTEFSMDGNNDGSLLDTYRYAIDAASLDYLMVSEHNGAGGPDVPYINFVLQQAADLFTLPGTFQPLYGYERSLPYPNGHRNVIFSKRGNPTLPIPPQEQKGITGAQALYAYLKKHGGIAISHTSATSMGTDWRDNDPEVEPLVEIYQGDRVSAEYEGAPKAANATNPASAPGGFRPAGYVWNAWAKGYKLGVQVASDHLSTHISYACTLATDFTKQGLIDAMKLRHSYGATDNIILDYRAESGGREYLQGEAMTTGTQFQLIVRAIGTKPIRQVDIVRNNEFVFTRHPMSTETRFSFRDSQPLAKESYYYVRVQQADDQVAWSSPIWVKRP
jgi:hypothetical protein